MDLEIIRITITVVIMDIITYNYRSNVTELQK